MILEEAIEFQPGYQSLAQIFFSPIFEEKREGMYGVRTGPTKLTNCCRRCCLLTFFFILSYLKNKLIKDVTE